MKHLFLLIFLLTIKISFSQSKKEQIVRLTKQVDSLNHLVTSQSTNIIDKNTQINMLNTKITVLESSVSTLNANVRKLNLEIQTFKIESKNKNQELNAKNENISHLQLQINSKNDSLDILRSEIMRLKSANKTVDSKNANLNTDQTLQITQTDYYKPVQIGNQTWMAENLNISNFRNGDPIPEAKTKEEWKKAGEEGRPAWCTYENNLKNGAKYGKLYNWFAVNDPRGLAPEGWHIPSDDDWTILENHLGDDDGKKMKSTSGWNNWIEDLTCKNCENWNTTYRKKTICHVCRNTRFNGKKTNSGNGINISGFSGLPGGGRRSDGYFFDIGYYGGWWSSSESTKDNIWGRYLLYDFGLVIRYYYNKTYGFSIRCLKD